MIRRLKLTSENMGLTEAISEEYLYMTLQPLVLTFLLELMLPLTI